LSVTTRTASPGKVARRRSLAAAALMAIGVLVAGASVAARAATPGGCQSSVLRASLHAGSPGASQRYAALRLTNRGTRACTIFGYAGRSWWARVPAGCPRASCATAPARRGA